MYLAFNLWAHAAGRKERMTRVCYDRDPEPGLYQEFGGDKELNVQHQAEAEAGGTARN